jgi:SMC interacting uncharacterized protein involved in chromosome segregation
MFDTLRYAKRLQEIGLPREQAEGFAELQREIMDERLATKTDILRLETVIKRLEESTKTDILRLESLTKTEILRLESLTKTEIARLEESTKTEIARLETEIKRLEREMGLKLKDLESRLTIKLGGMLAGAVFLIVALDKFV